MRAARLLAVLLCAGLAGCAGPALRPDASRLATWTTALRDREPDGPRVAVYLHRGRPVVFVGAVHETAVDSPTFRLLGAVFERFTFDTALVEGVAYADGPDPARLLAYVERSVAADGVQPGGETVPAVRGARRQGAAVRGGEPSDADVLDHARAWGVSETDVLGFYVLRAVPQWLQERAIDRPSDPRLAALVDAELGAQRLRLGLGPELLPDHAAWAAWYAQTNGRAFGDGFQTEEVGPLADGPHGTNRAAYAVSRVRDAFLLRRVADHAARGEALLVVYGASHLTIARPALDALLGAPCHAGPDLSAAPPRCRG